MLLNDQVVAGGVDRGASKLRQLAPEGLGSSGFRSAYGVRYAYLAGSMYKGIASKELVVAMGRAGLMGFLGSGGMKLADVESAIDAIQFSLRPDGRFGVNVLADPSRPEMEDAMVDLLLRKDVRYVEASAFMQVPASLVRYRLAGIKRLPDGTVTSPRRLLAKVSRPEVAEPFMRPASPPLLKKLVGAGQLTQDEARLGEEIPVAQDICVEADSGGHTDRGVAPVLLPAMLLLRDRIVREQSYAEPVYMGAAGGIGTPAAAMAAFLMGADFVVTGSINQCTVEAGTSDAVKDLLQDMNVQDTDYAPAGDMFEFGAKVQVLKKGLLFASRANKLYELYTRYDSLDEIDARTKAQIEDKFFKRSFDNVWAETRAHWARRSPSDIAELEKSPKRKMALIFKWYFVHSTRLAMAGAAEQKVDYQVHCGPALGALNQWVKGSALESWRQRRVADLAERLMQGAAQMLNERFAVLLQSSPRGPQA